jgi:hypothetical protein
VKLIPAKGQDPSDLSDLRVYYRHTHCLGCDEAWINGVRECITEMIAVVSGSLLSKVKQDVRFKDTRTCEQCFADFNDSGRHERFCSDTCEEENDTQVGGDDDADLREDDCS